MSLAISGLCAGYGRRNVLHDIDVSVIEPGTFVGLIGPNAAGKSTLFKAIAGLLKPEAGAIRLADVDVSSLKRKELSRQVAYMPQAFGCNAALTVFESVLLALKQTTGWRTTADDLDRVAATLDDLGLSHLAERGLGHLSGGQSQMAAVAQTLVREPAAILLDEPTSALDLHHQLSVMTAIRRAALSRGAVVFAALHDLNLAAQFCDRLVLIREGRVLADGPPGEVLALREIGDTYRVRTSLETTRRGTYYVDAAL